MNRYSRRDEINQCSLHLTLDLNKLDIVLVYNSLLGPLNSPTGLFEFGFPLSAVNLLAIIVCNFDMIQMVQDERTYEDSRQPWLALPMCTSVMSRMLGKGVKPLNGEE